mmetsp:Transcript_13097/g.35828  ORF Transcript_13097/g.35828 Transcript_13097/m.35828 type:complete len:268 (+) Transcript_13097:53-856(+)
MEACGSDGLQHLARSRYEEDIRPRGHAKIWGSLYCSTSKRWGFACCKALQRDAPGCIVAASDLETDAAGSELESQSRARNAAETSQEVREWKPRDEFETPEGFVAHAAKFFVSCWRTWLSDGTLDKNKGSLSAEVSKVLLSEVSAKEAARGVEVFCGRLASREVPNDLARQLEEFCTCVGSREYVQANKAYMDMVMGNRKWQSDVPYLVEGNRNGPAVVQSVAERLNKSMSHPLDVAGIRDHTVLLRRLLSVCQAACPNTEPSKNCG